MRVWDDFQWFSLHKEKDFSCFPLVLANFLKYWGIKRQQSGEGLSARPKGERETLNLYRNNQNNIYIYIIYLYIIYIYNPDKIESSGYMRSTAPYFPSQFSSCRTNDALAIVARTLVMGAVGTWRCPSKVDQTGDGWTWWVKVSISEDCIVKRIGMILLTISDDPQLTNWIQLLKLWPWC